MRGNRLACLQNFDTTKCGAEIRNYSVVKEKSYALWSIRNWEIISCRMVRVFDILKIMPIS